MGSTSASPTLASPDTVTEAGVLTREPSPSIGDHTNTGDGPSPHPSTIGCAQRHADTGLLFYSDHYLNARQFRGCDRRWTSETRGRGGGIGKVRTSCANRLFASECGRLVAAALSDSVAALRKDDETRLSQYVRAKPPECHGLMQHCHRLTTTFQGGLLAFRDGEEKRLARSAFPQVFNGICWDLINSVSLQVGEGNCGFETNEDQDRPCDELLDRLQESCRRTRR